MEYLKTLWREARPRQRAFAVAVAVIVVLGLLASAAKAGPLEDIKEMPGVECDFHTIEAAGVVTEQCFSEEPVVCIDAAQYPGGPQQFAAQYGMVLIEDKQLTATEWLYVFAVQDGSLGFVYNRTTGQICLHVVAQVIGEAL